MTSQSKPPAGGGEEITLDGDMDLDSLVAELDAKHRPKAPPSVAEPATTSGDDLEMVSLDEEPAAPVAPAAPAAATDDLEMVEIDGGADAAPAAAAADDVEIVDVDAQPEAPPPAPLPDWLGDDVPAKPLVETKGLAVDLSAPLPEAELDLRHEFQRETQPDPKYLFEETKELAKEDEEDIPYIVCNKCGARNKAGLRTCRNCGDKLKIPDDLFEQYYQEQ